MRKPWLLGLLLFTLLGLSKVTHAAVPAEVKVGLTWGQTQITLPLGEKDRIIDLSGADSQWLPTPVNNQFVFSIADGTIYLNNAPLGEGPFQIIPGDTFLLWNSRKYRGNFLVMQVKGKLALINQIDLESYLRGVLPMEVPPKWPMAALKAQAIAARTYTIASLGKYASEGFDLSPNTDCHVYGGAGCENPNTDTAVSETCGQVLVYKGKVINAMYHASGGGYTEDPVNIWGVREDYLKSVPDWDQNSPYFQWVRTVEWQDLQGAVSRSYPKVGKLQRVTPALLGDDGHVYKVTLKGETGEVTITGEQFRFLVNLPSSFIKLSIVYGPEPLVTLWWLKNSKYPEAAFTDALTGSVVEAINPPWDTPDPWGWLQDKEPLRIIIQGNGWGHRVGMSQWGAKGMADAGYSAEQILLYYYQGVYIVNTEELR